MYGKGMMGSHASQLTEDERWQIVSYVWYDLRGEQMASVETEEVSTEVDDEVVTENNNH
jgi:hypothetical protein